MIFELLDDPLVSLVIRADRVDRKALAGDLRRLAGLREAPELERARGFMSRAEFFRPQSDLCGACGT
jgi:hypothetical protein